MKTTNFENVNMSAILTNCESLKKNTKGARQEIKSLSLLYFAHQLNKLAFKNQFIEGINIKALGKDLRANLSKDLFVNNKDLFTVKCFTKDSRGRACYIAHSKKCPKWGMDITNITPQGWDYLRPVTLSLSGLISAYKFILMPYAREKDKLAREKARAEQKRVNAQASKARAEAKRQLRKAQELARIDYASGKIDINAFAEIMAKTA